ncbi:unnamed protein product [Owenia fusiformis]|uniref:Sulfotransferase domain-containing protein n=2 Tax=Owenia fusiformis TaxID=6347 RepID=A0A8J1XI14_OWEFU|nr:unnamed protein product [Owenia fusiformis]
MKANVRPISFADCQNVFKIILLTVMATAFCILVLFTLADKDGTRILVASDHLTIETHVDASQGVEAAHGTDDEFKPMKGVTKVIVLGYKRGGTSFFGELLHTYPKTQYLFEPLVGVYAHMYGGVTVPPWSIRAFANGTIRDAPDYEVNYIAETLNKMFNCDYNSVHIENFKSDGPLPAIHSVSYKQCIKQNGLKKWPNITYSHCDRPTYMNDIPPECVNPDVYDDISLHQGNKNRTTIMQHFNTYNSKVKLKWNRLLRCTDDLRKNCSESNQRVYKLIRMNMKTAVTLLERYSDIKVIHYIRDPRGIQNSRVDTVTSFAFEDRMTLVESSDLLCRLIWNDILVASRQPLHIARRILQVRYEDVVNDPKNTIEKIDEFLDRESQPEMLDWLNLNTNCPNMTQTLSDSQPFALCKNASYTMDKWRERLSPEDIAGITKTCSNVLKHFKYS